MLKEYDFIGTQVSYVKAAMDLISSFTPDNKTPTQVETMITNAGIVRTAYLAKVATLKVTQGTRHTEYDTLHEAGIAFLAQASSAFRAESSLTSLLKNIPIADQTLGKILTRGRSTDAAWTKLSEFGPVPVDYTIKMGTVTVTQSDFQDLITAAELANIDIPVDDADFQTAMGDLHKTQDKLADFVTAALDQGRSQFPDLSSPERILIDAIPTKPAFQKPEEAHILTLTKPEPEEINMTYEALHGTGYNILHLAPGATVYVQVATLRTDKSFSMNGLADGLHTFRVVPHNSRGFGIPATAHITL